MSKKDRELTLFLGLTAALSGVFWMLLVASPGLVERRPGTFSHLLMWCPGVAALATCWVTTRSLRGLGWRWPGWRWLIVAFVLPLGFAAVHAGVWASGLAGIDHTRFEAAARRFGLGELPIGLAYPLLLVVLPAVGLLVDWLFALGEELGWRGYLVPALASRMGFTGTSVVSGLIWAAWHLPLIVAFVPRVLPGPPLPFALLFFGIAVVGMSFAYAWLRLRSGSVWPAVVLHACSNLVVQGILDRLTLDTGPTRWLAGEYGAGAALVGAAVGLLFWSRRRSLTTRPSELTAGS